MSESPPNAEQVNRAITWYRREKSAIAQRCPIATPGRIFRSTWLDVLEKHVALWESGSLGLHLAMAYIYWPLKTVRAALYPKF
ncbi:hypothetical protein [cf. Phormidesmis sp. LEGE 11477]|uniref:hypothetical protein n=1 Tax=cf. Phormidesmis sp. LEGE 11477 TaxID=1828680 RepID=UPI001880BE06|nr:hypothetical protein [cf. Phormidesmis sp. LEGE 11477]MBE9060299.1 hypothetical protein [cf. Phormidesmis sp. LEGE 11477]